MRRLLRERSLRAAVFLLIATAAYNVLEGVIAVVSGVQSGSLTLIAFGADSYLEVLAAGAVLWRLTFEDEEAGERAEGHAIRIIGWTFLVLAAAVVFQAIVTLAQRDGAEESTPGLVLLATSVVVMPLLSLAKLRVAARARLGALAAEARETSACSYLSLTALAGLVAVTLFGWWWLDAVTALLLVPWLVREGLEGVRGEACFEGLHPCACRPCFYGLRDCRPGRDGCIPACC